jgi:predicted enzyme related to lactoylglutathione lyase
MAIVKRIVTNLAAPDPSRAHRFYRDILGLDVAMDMGWIVTFASEETAVHQISVASEGGSGTPVPDVSIEVDGVSDVYKRMKSEGFEIVYEMTDEPWGVRRFQVLDPAGKRINILSHTRQRM